MASLIRPHAIAAARRGTATLARSVAQRSAVAAARTLPSTTIASRSSFSTTPHPRGSGTTDAELSSRLAQELSYERDNSSSASTADEPDFLRDFKSTNTWTIQDVRGSDEICLEREFGNEKIRVLFSIGDIDAPEGNEGEDDGMEGEESSGRDNGESDDDGNNEPALPVRCAITISKPSNLGALTIDAQAESGQFTIENISFYKDSTLATELTAEADWKRRGLYIGPQFPTLDDALQEHFQGFLEERGIDDDLALFVPLFAEWKEQKGELGVAQRTGAQADLLDSIARTHRVLHLA